MESRSLAVEIDLMSAILDRCDDVIGPARYPAARCRCVQAARGAARHRRRTVAQPSDISFGLLTNKAAPFLRLT